MKPSSFPVKIDKRTPMVVVLGLAVVFALWWFYAKPASEKFETAQAERARITSEVAQLQQKVVARKNGGEDYLATMYGQVQAANALLPQSANLTDLLVEIPSSASQQGLTLAQLDPSEPASGDAPGLMKAPFTVSVTGSTSAVTAWLDELQSGDELRTVEGLKKTAAEGGTDTTATFTLNVWYSTTPPLQAAQSAPAPAGAAPGGATPAPAPAAPAPGTAPAPSK